MDEIARKRAEKLGDSREWSAKDALEDTIKEIEGKEVELAIHWWVIRPDGTRDHHYAIAGLTFPVHIALLEISKTSVIEQWRGLGS